MEIIDSKWISEINNFDDISFTPLMWAARNMHTEAAKILLEAGADVNAHDFSKIGNTVLREVIEFTNLELVKLLLSYGADPFICGWMGMNALDKAKDQYAKHPSVEAGEIISMLENAKKS